MDFLHERNIIVQLDSYHSLVAALSLYLNRQQTANAFLELASRYIYLNLITQLSMLLLLCPKSS